MKEAERNKRLNELHTKCIKKYPNKRGEYDTLFSKISAGFRIADQFPNERIKYIHDFEDSADWMDIEMIDELKEFLELELMYSKMKIN